jgi:glucose uptake protein
VLIPTTYVTALLLAVLAMLCWGSWANTLKMSGKWRFELYYFDYTFGVLLAAVVAGLTFGSIEGAPVEGVLQFGLLDNLALTSKSSIAYAVGAGVIFNLANLLLVAAIAVAGLAVAFPVGIGLALIVGVIWSYAIKPAGNPVLLFSGCLVVLAAMVVCSLAHRALEQARAAVQAQAPAAAAPDGRMRHGAHGRSGARRSPWKGVLLSLVSGLLMGSFFPLVEMSKRGDLGLGPYGAAVCFSFGVLFSTLPFNLVFMNVPVEGEPVGFRAYFRGTPYQHLLGIAGGMIWAVGMIASFTAASAPRSVNVGPAVSYALGQGATLISTLWGLLVWKEFAGASPRVRVLVAVMLVLFTAGLAMVSVAPLFGR